MSDLTASGSAIDDLPDMWDGFMRMVRPGLGLTAFGANIMNLPPDYTTRSHDESHSGQEELYVRLAGDGWIVVDDSGERLALEHGQGAHIGVEEVEAVAALSAERQVWGLVDALVAGDERGATRAFLELRAQGETLPRLVPLMARRVRDVLAIATRLEAGESPAQVKDSLKMSPWAADRRIKEARATDAATLRLALEALAELEVASRGQSELGDDTEALRAIAAIAA